MQAENCNVAPPMPIVLPLAPAVPLAPLPTEDLLVPVVFGELVEVPRFTLATLGPDAPPQAAARRPTATRAAAAIPARVGRVIARICTSRPVTRSLQRLLAGAVG